MMKVIDCRTLSEMCEHMLDGEPCFLLRAQDLVSIPALEHYIDLAHDAHGNNITRAREVRDRFRHWQEQNPNRVKKPD